MAGALFIGIFLNVLATSLNEGAAFFEKWRQAVDEAENLKKRKFAKSTGRIKGPGEPALFI